MKPSEINERNDHFTAWVVTIIIHLALLAGLFFMAMPSAKQSVDPTKPVIENQSVQSPATKIKPKA